MPTSGKGSEGLDLDREFMNCWICGEPGELYSPHGSRLQCKRHPEGIVIWMSFAVTEARPVTEVMWMSGRTVPVVDFTKPGAPSSPA